MILVKGTGPVDWLACDMAITPLGDNTRVMRVSLVVPVQWNVVVIQHLYSTRTRDGVSALLVVSAATCLVPEFGVYADAITFVAGAENAG